MNTPAVLIVIILDVFALLVVGSFATAAIRSANRKAERENIRHDATLRAHADERQALIEQASAERTELMQTIAFLGQRGGPPQAWAARPLPEEAALAARIAPADVILAPDELPVPYEVDEFVPGPESNGSIL